MAWLPRQSPWSWLYGLYVCAIIATQVLLRLRLPSVDPARDSVVLYVLFFLPGMVLGTLLCPSCLHGARLPYAQAFQLALLAINALCYLALPLVVARLVRAWRLRNEPWHP